MGTYNTFSRVTGKSYPFIIDGDTPTQTEMARITQILAQEEGLTTEQVEQDQGNLFTRNIGRGIDTIQQAYGSAVEGIGESTGLDFLKNYGASVVESNRKELEASQEAARQLDDIKDVGSFFDYAGATLGSQVPQLGSTLAGSAAGFLVGGPAGAVVGGLAANLPFFYGSNREAQKEEVLAGNRIEVSEGAAALTAIPQSILDLIADRFLVGGFTGKLVGGGGLFTKGVKAGIKQIGRRGAIGAAKGVITEVPTEIGQQVLERLQAGKSLTNKEAIDEYKEVAAAAALIGGTVSSTGTIVAGSKEKKLTKDEELNRDQANEALQTQQQINNAENFLNTKGLPAPRTSPAEVQDDTVADLETEDKKTDLEKEYEGMAPEEIPFFIRYNKALDAIKKSGKINPTIIRNAIREEGTKIPKAEVEEIIQEMSRRGDIKSVGKNKFEVMQDDLDTYKSRASALKSKAKQILEDKQKIQDEIDQTIPIPAVDADPVTIETNRQRLEQKNLEYDNVIKEAMILERDAADYIKQRYGTTDVKGTTDQRVAIENPVTASAVIPDLTAKKSFDVADKKKLTDNYMNKRDVVMKKLSDRMKAIGLGDVVLRQENILTGNPNESPAEALQKGQIYEGYFQTEGGKPTIALAMEIYDPNLTDAELEAKIGSVLNHEVIHALKRMGLFNAQELKTLTDAVSKRKYVVMENGKPVERQYTFLDRAERMNRDLTAEAKIEEAIAEMYRAYADGRIVVGGKPKTLLQKITKFIKSIFGAHEDVGITDVDQIFENIGTTDQEKQIGRRKRDPESAMERQNSLLNTQASLSDQFTGDVRPKVRPSRTIPQRVKTAYKLFVQRADGQLLPLFVNAADPIPVGQFIEADFPTATFVGKSSVKSEPSFYVPTKGAERTKGEVKRKTGTQIIINSEQDRARLIQEGYITEKTSRTEEAPFGKVTAVAARPGFHASVKAYALHLGPEDLQVTKKEADKLSDLGMVIKPKEGKYFVKRRAEDHVFAEVSMADDINYQEQIDASDRTDINDRVPLGGSYVYTDGQANQDWLVGGDMRIDRVLLRHEAQSIAESQGVKDLPYKAEVEKILGRKLSSDLPIDEKSVDRKGIAFSRKQLDPKLLSQSIIKNYKTDDNGNILTKAQLGDENPFIRSAPAGTVKLEDALQKLQDERGGAVYDINNAEDREAVSQIIAEEARVAMERDDSAIGWYDRTLKLAKKVIGVAHPEVDKSNPAYNPDNEAAFDFALSITSNGLAIIPNFKMATEQYEHWVENGTFKEEGKDAGMRKAFFAYNTMKETMSDAEITEFLNSDFTMGELKALPIIKELGITVSSTETVNTIVKGSQIFGSKIGGAFYQNVRGNYDALTMDRWFMRFFNRITGNPFKVIGENVLSDNKARLLRAVQTAEAQRNNFLINAIEDAKDEANIDIINDATAIELAAALDRQYQVAFSKTPVELRDQKTELDLAAQSLNRNANTQVVETPRSGGDRAMMRLVINRARQILAENGINISNADIQALLWYAEKDLLDAYGVRKGQGLKNDYVDGAIAVLRERGIENETITEALPESERNRLDSDTNTERKIEGVYNPNDIVTEEETDVEQEVEEYDVSEGLTEQEKSEQQKLQDEFDKFNRVMSAAVNPNKLINVPLADPTESVFGNRYFYGTVKGPQGRMTNVVLTEGFHEYKGTDKQGNPIYSGEGLAHILGERGRKPSRKDELLVPTEDGNWIKYKNVETAIYETLKAYKHKNGVRQRYDGKSTDLVLFWDKARIAGKNKANKTLALVLKYKKDTYSQPVYVVNTTFLEDSDRRVGTQRVNSMATIPTTDTTPQSDQIVEDIEKKRLNIQYNNLAPILGKIVSKVTFGKIEKEKAQKEAEKILIKFQDALLPVGAMLDELKKKGYTIADALDTYLQEELFHGRAGAKVEDIQEKLFVPLSETIKSINISDQKLNELISISNFYKIAQKKYIDKRLAVADAILYARHAKERNDYINKNKPGGRDKGSGMANKEADAIINWLSTLDTVEGGKLARIENISRQIIANTNQQRLESGLIKPELLDSNFKSKVYNNYVPLRGDIESEVETEEDLMGKTRMTTNLFGAAGKEDRSALGQTDYAENIIASMMAQNQRSIDRGERNKVGQSFANLLRGFEEQPDGTFKVNEQLKTHMEKIARFVDDMPKKLQEGLDKNRILTIKENGVEVKVHFEDARIGRALKGHLTPESVGKFTKALGKMNKYLSSINTTYNPAFVIPNFARDLETAGVNMQQYDQKGMTKEVLTSTVSAVKGIAAVLRGGKETYWSEQYRKFVSAGGKNATNQMGDLQDQINNIGDILGDISDTGIKKKLGLNKNGFTRKLLNFLDDYNTAVENGVRVSVFTSLTKRGVSPARAAQAARNVTVNFAKGGENKTLMNSWYLFYNASLQGSMALINAAAKSKKVRKVWAGLVIYGIMQDQLNSLLSDDEDEDGIKDYDELPRYVLEHNLILPTFGLAGDKFIMIPLSYGLNLGVNFGRSLSRAARGEYTAGEASRSIFGTAFESISPFGGFDNMYNLTAPTVLDPFVSLAINEDYKGDPIYKESPTFSSRPTPDSQAYWSNTSSIAKGIADNINSLTGGDAVSSGYIDFSPNTLEFWFDYFAGGTGAFVQRTLEAPPSIYDALQGDFEGDIMRAIPLVRKVVISPSEREDVGNYLKNRQELFTILARIDLARKSGDTASANSLFTEYKDQVRISGRLKAIDNARNRLLRQIKEIDANPRIPEKTKSNLKRIRREKINDLMRQGLILMRSVGLKEAG